MSLDIGHHDQAPTVQATFGKDVLSLINVIEDLGNPFEEESTNLLVLDSKEIADHAAVEMVKNIRRIGQEQFQTFVKERLIERSETIDDVIHRNKLKLFKSTTQNSLSKGMLQVASLKCDVELFSRLYIGCQTREGNLEEFFSHENQAYPPALSDGSKLHLDTKSDLLACLIDHSECQSDAPVISSIIIDGAVITQMLKPVAVKNFGEYAFQIFIPYILLQFQNASRVDLVWDRYIDNTLKSTARAKRSKGTCRCVVSGALIPRNWQDFLLVDSNKIELFQFLSHALIDSFKIKEKQLVITNGDSILSKPLLDDLDLISPCTHEEADTRMLLHVHHATHHGHNKLLIRTVDTDIRSSTCCICGKRFRWTS